MLNGIIYGLSYFTVLPFKLNYFEANKQFYKGVVYSLPLSGFILSLLIIFIYNLLPYHIIYNAIFTSILYLFLYGFLHLEATADTIDGYFASLSKKDIYQIMHEPQIGAVGAVGTFCFALFNIIAIAYALYLQAYFVIIVSLILSRLSIIFALELDYHPKSSFVLSLKENNITNDILKIILFPLRFFTKYILNILKEKFGFLNGDTLGFVLVLNEIILLNIGLALC